MNRRDRFTASSWAILAAFFFVVVHWSQTDVNTQNVIVLFNSLRSWKLGWLIFAGVCVLVLVANLAYPVLSKIEMNRRRSTVLAVSVITNLSILGFFKYFNFFVENMEMLLRSLNFNPSNFRLDILLPVGISFYTFQTMSYTIDIYRKKLEPASRYTDFALFVAYFPQLVAGPIERAVNLLPKICTKRTITIDQTFRGLHLIFYGLFKKVVIADGVARTVNQVFGSTSQVGWADVVVGTILFAIQIYCDFSGYSDIARGVSKLFGIDIMLNFNFPYFSQNPREFWSRWHISLSTWLRDYLYIPLGGNRGGEKKTYRNIMLTMLLGGLWHGAAWNFVLWGFYHGAILCVHRKISAMRHQNYLTGGTFLTVFKTACFFTITVYGWLLFRSPSFEKIAALTSTLIFDFGNLNLSASLPRAAAIFGMPFFLMIETVEYLNKGRSFYRKLPIPVWTSVYAFLFFCLAMGMNTESAQFIYFQF